MPVLLVSLAISLGGLTACAATGSSVPVASTPGLGALPAQVAGRIESGRYPGAVFAVARGDRLLTLQAVGVANLESGAPMRPDSIFRMMSMTKPVTAVATMILVQEGKLDLDAPVSRYLPEFSAFGVEGAPPLTLRRLLTHTSGIGFGKIPAGKTTLAEQAREIAARKMRTPVGASWAYSGVNGPDVVARVVEVVAGEPYQAFVKRRIFDPLGMIDTTYSLTPQQEARLVGLYEAKDGKINPATPPLPPAQYPSGGAGLFSTAADYIRLAEMLAADGERDGVRILSPASVAELRKEQLAPDFPGLPTGIGSALLMRRVVDPAAAKSPLPAGAYGWSGAYGTHFWVDPASGVSAVWMINLSNAGGAGSADALDFEGLATAACNADRKCAARQ